MAVIRPFQALRPSKENAQKVASVPYDVLNRDEAYELVKDNPLSFLNITRSEVHFSKETDPHTNEIYTTAKEKLEEIRKSAPLVQDEKPYFYLYRLVMDGRPQTGIAATFSVDDYENNVILKHEKTRKEKEDDRTNHIITTKAQTGPVFLTYKGIREIDQIVDVVIAKKLPEYDFTAEDGIQHTIWILPEEYNETIITHIRNVNHLYIADGHHRAASAFRSRNAMADALGKNNGDEEFNFFIAVLFPAEQLQILPYNRIVHDLNGKSEEQFMNEVKQKFNVEETKTASPTLKRNFGMYINKKWYLLTPKDSINASNMLAKSVSETLDVSVLQDFLLNPILGIDDPRTNKRVDFVGGIRGTAELEKLVDSGKAAVAFSLYPVSVDDLMNISDAGEIMPPKSTWFEPKLRDGLLVHLI